MIRVDFSSSSKLTASHQARSMGMGSDVPYEFGWSTAVDKLATLRQISKDICASPKLM